MASAFALVIPSVRITGMKTTFLIAFEREAINKKVPSS
jgi:hypothetical protein